MVNATIFRTGLIPTRSLIWIMIFTCTFVLYMIRINLSIIILAMVEPSHGQNSSKPECSTLGLSTNNDSDHQHPITTPDYGVRYDWNTKLQGLILGSYFWGFTISGFFGGPLAERFGPAKLVTISFVLSGGMTLLGPLAASWHAFALIFSRFLIGLFGGVIYPCLHCLVSRWAPPEEKGKFVGALLGGALGTVATWPLLGSVIEKLGWTWAFYINGAIVLIWCLVWVFLVSDSPATHRLISETEKSYIEKSLAGNLSKSKKKAPPLKAMALSVPFWAFVILHFGNLWGLFFLMTAGPNFMSSVLGFNLGHTGVLASLPYLARLIAGIIFGAIGDLIRRKEWMSTTTTRKSFVLLSHVMPGLLLVVQTFTGCDVNWAIVLITMSLGLNGSCTLTNLQNSQDLAPNYAGTLYGISNAIGSTTGFISPLIVGYLTAEHNGLHEWHIIFYIGASVYILCGIIFCIFGSGDIQPWNDTPAPLDSFGVQNPAFIEENATEENTKI